MRAEFYKDDNGSKVIASAAWDGRRVRIDSSDPDARKVLERVFRLSPVVVDDAAYRPLGASGESVIQPGALDWFRAAAFSRAPEENLAVRFVPEVVGEGGWDPAAAYRTFEDAITRLIQQRAPRSEPQAGEQGYEPAK